MGKIHERLAAHRPGLWPSALSPGMLAQISGPGEPRWSPDGRRLSYLRSFNAEGRLFVQPSEGGAPIQVTSDPMAAPGGAYRGGHSAWSPDGASLAYLAEDGKLWVVASTGGIAHRLSEGEGSQHGPAWSPDGRSIAYVDETEERETIVVASVPTDGHPTWPRPLSDADFVLDPAWSPDGRFLAWQQWNVPEMPWDGSEIVLADVASGERRVVAGSREVATAQPCFSPDGRYLAFLSDQSGYFTLWLADGDGNNPRPLLKEPFEVGPPVWGPGARSFAWSPDSSQIAYLMNVDGNWQLYVLNLANKAVRPLDRATGQRGGLDWSADDELVYVYGAPTHPPRVQSMNVSTGETKIRAIGTVGGVAEAGLVSPEALTWTARDGATLYGHLYPPRQPTSAPTPLLVLLHGGPTSQFGLRWSADVQYFAQRGWTIFAPEYRGSTGYGRAYAQALRGNWGIFDVDDTLDGIEQVVRRGGPAGAIDDKRIAVMGGSAGGYTVLMLLALAGDRIRAGVDLFGVTDLWELEHGTHRLEAHYNHILVGPLPEAAALYNERSPLNLADKIKSPLLVLQGEDDPVVPKWESDLLVERVRAAGGQVDYHVYPGEGHGWSRAATVQDALERTDRFLVNQVILR